MSEKVTLPKEVAEAIEDYKDFDEGLSWRMNLVKELWTVAPVHMSRPVRIIFDWKNRKDDEDDTLFSVLANGYEVEQTPEDKVREYYERLKQDQLENTQSAEISAEKVLTITTILNMLSINIPGVPSVKVDE